jgi:DNA-binding IscR family transcriptional regulator
MLAREPRDISLLDVVEAIDGPITLNECVLDETACHVGGECPLRDVWCDAQSELVKRLMAADFSQIAVPVH